MEQNQEIITANMLVDLPAPVQRYLIQTGVVGKPRVKSVLLKQTGAFRRALDQPWMPMKAEQIYSINPPGFVWKAHFSMGGLPLMRARDSYENGEGHMFARLAWVVPIFDVRGEKLTQGTMLRYLQEMMWFPTAFVEPFITWKAVDDSSADVTFTDAGKHVTGRMFFDRQGRVTNFIAERYREINGDFELNTWSTPVEEYGTLGGLNLPVRGAAVWKLPSGDLLYAKITIQSVQFNNSWKKKSA